MNILYVTGEAAPFCKTGGLADVSGSLPVALARRVHKIAVMLPLYDTIAPQWRRQMTFRKHIYVDLSWRHEYCGLFSLDYQGVTWYFVDNEHYFARGRLYGEGDDGERFGFFSRAVGGCSFKILFSIPGSSPRPSPRSSSLSSPPSCRSS